MRQREAGQQEMAEQSLVSRRKGGEGVPSSSRQTLATKPSCRPIESNLPNAQTLILQPFTHSTRWAGRGPETSDPPLPPGGALGLPAQLLMQNQENGKGEREEKRASISPEAGGRVSLRGCGTAGEMALKTWPLYFHDSKNIYIKNCMPILI